MNPDTEDPNNHVPAVSPGDDWDDLEVVSEASQAGLPPRRMDQGLPPKKVARTPRVNRLSPTLKLDGETLPSPPSPSGGDSAGKEMDAVAEDLEEADSSTKAAKKAPRKSVRKHGSKDPASPPTSPEAEKPEENRVVLPDAQPAKRLRVNEIGSANDAPAARPEKMVAKAAVAASGADKQDGTVKRRHFSRGERSEWGAQHGRGSWKWMLYTGLGVVCLVVLALVLSQLTKRKNDSSNDEPLYSQLAGKEVESQDSSEDLKDLELLTNSHEKAKSIFAVYARAKTPEDFIAFVHAPERNRQVIEGNWKPLAMKPGWLPGDESVWTVLDRNGIRYAVLDGILSDFTSYRAFFRKDGGELKLDWKATAGYGTADFAEMKKGGGSGKEIRATISIADFYTFSFPEETYRSFRIMSADGEANLWGYAALGSEIDERLLELFLPSQITGESQSEIQVTLHLEPGNGESLPDQWILAGIERLSWLDE